VLARCAAFVVLLALSSAGSFGNQPPAAPEPSPPVTQPARSVRNASYVINARLDTANRTLGGEELITWRNTSTAAAKSLQFHLYYNAWRNNRSTWMRELQDAVGLAAAPEPPTSDSGWTDITSLRVIRGGPPVDATSRIRFIAPDDGNAEDRTVAEVPLDAPVAPGETINVRITWSSRVPRTFARTGVVGDSYFLAQWFPKIGVLEDSGWNCHQFHLSTEFFADFGNYDVRLTVPTGWVVGATGVERSRRDEGNGTTTHQYYQEDVHDFAWTTSPRYLERTAQFEHPTLPPVRMRLLVQPEHEGQADRHFAATRAALKHYGEWFGAYPYAHITIVDPAWQSEAGGMEYPTLITAGTRWLAPKGVAQPEAVTVHEAGHQFVYGVLATNEFEHAWMDEGINTFAAARTMAEAFEPNFLAKRYFGGFIPWTFRDVPLTRAVDGDQLGGYRVAANSETQATPSWQYWPRTAGHITYDKTAVWLHTLERMLGWQTLQRILSTYYSRWAFKHPKPDDFFAVVNEVSGQDLTWFIDQVYRSSATFDYAVDSLRSESVEQSTDRYRTRVVVRRLREGIFPLDIRVVFENGQDMRWRWNGRDRWKSFELVQGSRAKFAEVDPDRVLLLDLNTTNNSVTLAPKARQAARKWSLAWLIWLQDHLLTYGFFI
jgi:aminopeptidase N